MALARLPARRRYAVRIFAVMLVISLGLVIASVAYLDRLYTRTMTAELTDSAATLLDSTAGEFETLVQTLLSISLDAYYSPGGTAFRLAEEYDPMLSLRLRRELVQRTSSFTFVQSILMGSSSVDDVVTTGQSGYGFDRVLELLQPITRTGYEGAYALTTGIIAQSQSGAEEAVLFLVYAEEPERGRPLGAYVALGVYVDSILGSIHQESGDSGSLVVVNTEGELVLPVSAEDAPNAAQSAAFRDLDFADRPSGAERVSTGPTDTLVVWTELAAAEWVLVNLIPFERITSAVRSFQLSYVVFVAALVFVAIVAAYAASRFLYRPITRLLRVTASPHAPDDGETSDIAYIETTVAALRSERDAVIEENRRNRKMLREELLRLMLDELLPADMYQEAIDQIGLTGSHASIRVVLVVSDECCLEPNELREGVQALFPVAHLVAVRYDEEVVAVVIAHAEAITADEVSDRISSFAHRPGSTLEEANVAIGGEVGSYRDIAVSAQQAFHLLRYQVAGRHSRVVSAATITGELRSELEYPTGLEDELVRAMNALDHDRYRDVVHQVLEFCGRHTYDVFQHVIIQLVLELINRVATIQKTTANERPVSIKSLLRRVYTIRSERGVRALFEDVYELYRAQHQEHTAGITANPSALVTRVNAFVESELSNPLLSVEMVADHFDYSPSYFGTVYRSEAGLTLSRHITAVRMEVAEKLLVTTADSVKTIAQLTGFTNTNYFFGVFKQHTGMTPTQFRRARRARG